MASQVFYRKWRSRTLAEVVGQEPVTQTLLNALKSGRISHAYLFCGPRGTGKTSTARIMAKAVNCLTTGGRGEPCNACEICQSINEGRAMDVLEIDAASNNGVDDIRNLRERVNISPAVARRKVYIVDEFHMLSTAASNALLKTLEEPPPHVIFILATTEVHKILPTIMSRCQRFDFRRLSQTDITGKLTEISRVENITIEPEALRLVAKSAAGSLRDAENLLEQLTTYYGADVSFRQVQEMLGVTGDARVRELARHIFNDDVKAAVATINSVNNDGLDLKHFKRELVEYLRGLLLVKTGAQESVDLTADDLNEIRTLAAVLPLARILKALKLFSQAEVGTEGQAVLSLELAIIDASQKAEETLAPHAPRAEQPPPRRTQEAAHPTPTTHPPVRPVDSAPHATAAPVRPAASQTPAAAPHPLRPVESRPAAPARQPPPTEPPPPMTGNVAERLRHEWRRILEQAPLDVRKSPVVAILRSGVQPISFENGVMILSARSRMLKEMLEKIENQRIAERILSSYVGQSCRVQCVVEGTDLVAEAIKLGAQVVEEEE